MIKNPITLWMSWYFQKILVEFKYRKKHLKIGYNSFLKRTTVGRYNTLYQNASIADSSIDDFTYINNDSKISKASIGKFCSIANNVIIGLGSHPTENYVSSHPAFYSNTKYPQKSFADQNYFSEYSAIKIGHDVWIGTNSIILGGVTIGNGAIVAAGSLVNKDIPKYAIVGGVPAKIIKYRFSDLQIERLEKIKWWEFGEEWFMKNYKLMHNIDFLLNKYKNEIS